MTAADQPSTSQEGAPRRALRFPPGWLLGLRTGPSHQERALETTLDNLAERLAQAEIALVHEQRRHRATRQRAEQAETDLRRLQARLYQSGDAG